jgi:predicted esterase
MTRSAKVGPAEEKVSEAADLIQPPPDPSFTAGEGAAVEIPGDHSALVFHAPPNVHRAIVYLHGLCGDPAKIDSWAPAASAHGTIIALTGNRSCGRGLGRFKWGFSVSLLNQRIVTAVERVAAERGGRLDTSDITLIGYSQGAVRAEQMPRHYPNRYTHLVLAGGPTAPQPWLLAPTRAVVIVGGERDRTRHLRQGLRSLLSAGHLVAYMELPEARHGEFGPEGAQVMGTALWWLFDRAP